MRTILWWAGLALALAASPAAAEEERPRQRGAVEVAFVLDSTGSMGGLIEGAKQKIWSIANAIVSRAPEVRIGLVSYRDRGDAYVFRSFELTSDIDAVFADLQSLQAEGGGDDEESVNQALYEAVHHLGWSADPQVLKLVFLVGDYPPHMDYRGEVKYPETCRAAAARGLRINTVQCGGVPETTRVWKEIARLAEGSYVALEQSGNMQAVPTPYDEQIALLSREVGGTVLAWGARERRAEAEAKTRAAAAAPASVAADRAAFNLATGGKVIQGSGDLLQDLAAGEADLNEIREEELPPVLQAMSLEQRQAYLARQQALRDSLNLRLNELSLQRAAFLLAEQRRLSQGGDSFDRKVAEIVNRQLERGPAD